ncbi:peptidase S8 [Paenibacillus sp. 28ISP30-2]|nr:peptidase S8 [Paenibacillus sp. 28ISP30-2]
MSRESDKATIFISLKEGVNPQSVLPANISPSSNSERIEIRRVHSIESILESSRIAVTSSEENEKLFETKYKNMSETEKQLYRIFEVKLNKDVDVENFLEELKKNNGVERAELDTPNVLHVEPNDTLYNELYGLKNIQCEKAWRISQGQNVVVGVVDSGVDYNHPDIKENMWKDEEGRFGYDFSDDEVDPIDQDLHGTHVAGTVAAVGNNEMGIIGVAPKAKIMALRVFPRGGIDSGVISKALKYAVDKGAKVINNSWGPIRRRPSNFVIEQALDYVYEKGGIAVFSAGNENDEAKYYSPANYSKTISVGAVDINDRRAEFSNYDETVDVAAAGVEILSLQAGSRSYMKMDGTSMAAPHVSGLVALLLSKQPNLTFEQIKQILQESGDTIQTDKFVGKRINAFNALNHSLMNSHEVERELTGVGNALSKN